MIVATKKRAENLKNCFQINGNLWLSDASNIIEITMPYWVTIEAINAHLLRGGRQISSSIGISSLDSPLKHQ